MKVEFVAKHLSKGGQSLDICVRFPNIKSLVLSIVILLLLLLLLYWVIGLRGYFFSLEARDWIYFLNGTRDWILLLLWWRWWWWLYWVLGLGWMLFSLEARDQSLDICMRIRAYLASCQRAGLAGVRMQKQKKILFSLEESR